MTFTANFLFNQFGLSFLILFNCRFESHCFSLPINNITKASLNLNPKNYDLFKDNKVLVFNPILNRSKSCLKKFDSLLFRKKPYINPP